MSRDLSSQFLGEELSARENNAESARFHVVPVPLEATVSYGSGTAAGPQAILDASHQLERLIEGDEPCLSGIYTHPAIATDQPIEAVMLDLRQHTKQITEQGKIAVTLGGEHSLSYGAVMGVADALNKPIGIVQIDAHADLRIAYQGHKHSHASVMHLLAEEGIRLAQYGVRALCTQESQSRLAHNVVFQDGPDLVRGAVHHVELPDDFPDDIYISFDLDGLDPAILPATGTPVPGGLGFYQALDIVASACQGRRIVGMDIVELAPSPAHPASDFAAAMVVYSLMRIANLAD